MDYFINLCDAYLSYVRSKFDLPSGRGLVSALEKFGLPLHAEALNLFLSKGKGIKGRDNAIFQREKACVVSVNMPDSGEGSLWFDPLGIDFLVRQSSQRNPEGSEGVVWIGERPVRIWQYLVFLKLAKISERFRGSIPIDDFLKVRFLGEVSSAYVVNIYHQEASAFAAWHGRHLMSHFDLNLALKNQDEKISGEILPGKLSVWNGAILNEDKRLVLSNPPGSAEGVLVRECEEWFRQPDIGMFTGVIQSIGLNRNRLSDHFVNENFVVNNHLCRI